MNRRPGWAVSAWGGFICVLLGLSSFMHGSLAGSLLLLSGAIGLAGWAVWLARH